MDVYVLVYEDRHCDDTVLVYTTAEEAIAVGRSMIADYIAICNNGEVDEDAEDKVLHYGNDYCWLWQGSVGDDQPFAHVERCKIDAR